MRSVGHFLIRLCSVELTILLAGFIAGWAGYYQINPAPPWGDEDAFLLDALRFAAEIWFSGVFSLQQASASWLVYVAALSLPVALLLLLISAAWFWVKNSLRCFMIVRQGGHVIVTGSTSAVEFILSWNKPTLWVRAEPLSLADRLRLPWQGAVLVGNLANEHIRQQSGMLHAQQVLLLGENGAMNVQTAFSLFDALSALHISSWPCSLHVAVQSKTLVEEFERRLESATLPLGTEVQAFQTQVLGVRKLFLQRPTEQFKFIVTEQITRLVVIGLGDWGAEVLKSLLLEGHQVAPRQTEIVIVDRNAEYLERVFAENNPDRALFPLMKWISLDVQNDSAFARWLDEMTALSPAPSAYFVCLGQGELSYVSALKLESGLKARLSNVPLIYFYQAQPAQDTLPAQGSFPCTHPFGSTHDNLSEELLLQKQRDALARRIHERYLALCLKNGGHIGDRPSWQEWDRLAYTFKRENRSQADHHLFKLRQIACRLRNSTGSPAFVFEDDELGNLAIAEHSRWNASRLIAGWRYGAERNDAQKIHPDLVPYDQLTEVVKDYDRDAIRNLPSLFAELGWEIVRDLPLRIGPVETDSLNSLPHVGSSAWQLVREKYPNHFPVLLVNLAEAGERAIAFSWQAAGGVFHVISKEPIHWLMDRSDKNEQIEIAKLANQAEQILAVHGNKLDIALREISTHQLKLESGEVVIAELGNNPSRRTHA